MQRLPELTDSNRRTMGNRQWATDGDVMSVALLVVLSRANNYLLAHDYRFTKFWKKVYTPSLLYLNNYKLLLILTVRL